MTPIDPSLRCFLPPRRDPLSARLLKVIDAAGSDGIAKSKIIRRSQAISAAVRDQVLAKLVEEGDVFVYAEPTGGRPRLRYYSAKFHT